MHGIGPFINANNIISSLIRLLILSNAHLINLFAILLYQPVMLFAGNRVVRRVVVKQAYYATYAEWYIWELTSKPVNSFTVKELFHLHDLYKHLSEVRMTTSQA